MSATYHPLAYKFYKLVGVDLSALLAGRNVPAWGDVSAWAHFTLSETTAVIVIAGVLTVLRYAVQRWAEENSTMFGVTSDKRKFSESFWKLVFYTCSLVYGAAVICNNNFWWPTTLLWDVESEIAAPLPQ